MRDGYQSTKKASDISKAPKRGANVLAKQVKRPTSQSAVMTSQPEVTSQSVSVVNSQQYGHVMEQAPTQQLASVSPQHAPVSQLPPVGVATVVSFLTQFWHSLGQLTSHPLT